MSLWTWLKDKAYSAEVGTAGIVDLVAGTDYTATIISEHAPLAEQSAVYEAAKRRVEAGLLEQAMNQTKEDIKDAAHDVANSIPTIELPWWVWVGLGTAGVVALLASFGYAVRSIRKVTP